MEKQTTCQKCIRENGGCCSDVRFSVHLSEAKPFIQYFENENPKNHKLKLTKGDPEFYVYDSGNEDCIFLNDQKLCSIYADRPLMCRLYPLMWKEDKKFYIDLLCPLTHVIPLQKIYNWKNDPKNKRQLSQMEELYFDARERQYVNIKSLIQQNSALEFLDD